MQFKMTGLDPLLRHLNELQQASSALEGRIATVEISDPASIETAIAQMNHAVDEKIGSFQSNPLVMKIGADVKARCAAALRQRGEEALAKADYQPIALPALHEGQLKMDANSVQDPPTKKDEQRYLVLKYFYDYNEQRCADEQWSPHAAHGLLQQGHALSHGDVARAMTYLSDKGLLRVTERQAYIGGEETSVRGGITARGIDAVEHPDDFRNVLSPQVINYMIHGSMNVAHGDQQVVGRDNSGVLAQGRAHVEQRTEIPAFPAEQLRNDFAEYADALVAIDTLDNELKEESPRASIVTGMIETLKNVAGVAEIGKTFSDWLSDPMVHSHLTAIALRTFGS